MGNKIREIFSDDEINMGGYLQFRNEAAQQAFLSALKKVYRDGRAVQIEGVASITTTMQHHGAEFPVQEYNQISQFIIAPSRKPIHIPIMVDSEKINVTLFRWETEKSIEICFGRNSMIYFHFVFSRGETKHKFSYKLQFENAKTIADVVNNFKIAEALLEKLFGNGKNGCTENESDRLKISDIQTYFRLCAAFFSRLLVVEQEMGLSFSPERLTEMTSEEQHDVNLLYLLLCEKKVVRLNGKLTSTEVPPKTENHGDKTLSIGDKVWLTFLGTLEIKLLDQTVLLYTANLLVNAFVKEIILDDDGGGKILYGDTDSRPMYVAGSAFKTKEEAEQETDRIMNHIESYVEALTCNEYIGRIQGNLNN